MKQDMIYDNDVIVRDAENRFNANNFRIETERGEDIGNLPATLNNMLAPCVDEAIVQIDKSHISYMEKLSERSRYAKSGILFVEILLRILVDTAELDIDGFGGEDGTN